MATYPVKWVTLQKYQDLSGKSAEGIRTARRRGKFVDGTHTKLGPDGNLYVNLEAMDKWVEGYQESSKCRVA